MFVYASGLLDGEEVAGEAGWLDIVRMVDDGQMCCFRVASSCIMQNLVSHRK